MTSVIVEESGHVFDNIGHTCDDIFMACDDIVMSVIAMGIAVMTGPRLS
jgi:hypothetical protein